MGAWEDPDQRDRAFRLLFSAVQELIRTAAEMQSRNIDTQPLAEPVLKIQQAMAVLAGESAAPAPPSHDRDPNADDAEFASDAPTESAA